MRLPRLAFVMTVIVAVLATASEADAATHQLDTSFSQDGWVTRARPDTGTVVDILPRPGDKIVSAVDGLNGWMLQGYTDAGLRDPSFGNDGTLTVRRIDEGSIFYLTALANGGFIATGTTRILDGGIDFHNDLTIVAFRSDGSVDRRFARNGIFTYGEGTLADEYPRSVTILPDGSVLITLNEVTDQMFLARVLRLEPDGSRDLSFGTRGVVSSPLFRRITLFEPHVTASGTLSLAGSDDANGGSIHLVEARLTAAGTLDTTFDGDGVSTSDPIAFGPGSVLIKAVAGGWVACVVAVAPNQATPSDLYSARLTTAGAIDPAYGGGVNATPIGSVPNSYIPAGITRDGDGLTVAGSIFDGTGDQDLNLFHLASDGSLDPAFGGGSAMLTLDRGFREYPEAISTDPDGRILLGGQGYRSNGRYGPLLARLVR